MAVGVQLEFWNGTLDQYDRINEGIGRMPGGPAADRELFHWVTPTAHGFRVIDVWESRPAFEHYLRETLEPMFAEVGITVPPVIEFFFVYNYSVGTRRRR